MSRLLSKIEEYPVPEETEIIIVDASLGKLNDIKANFPKVRWLEYKALTKLSVAEQRNFGIKKAKGDIIVFIDADCVPTKKWLEELVRPIRSKNENIVAGLIKSVRKYPRKWEMDHKRVELNKYINATDSMNSAFKKKVFEKIGYYDNRFEYGSEDMDICYRAVAAGYKIRCQPSAIIYHDWDGIRRNILRIYLYGRANYRFFVKHISHLGINQYSYGIVIFPIFLLFFPLIIIFPYYPLLLIIPFIRNYKQNKSIELAFEHIIFGLLYGVGFIVDPIDTTFKKLISKN